MCKKSCPNQISVLHCVRIQMINIENNCNTLLDVHSSCYNNVLYTLINLLYFKTYIADNCSWDVNGFRKTLFYEM